MGREAYDGRRVSLKKTTPDLRRGGGRLKGGAAGGETRRIGHNLKKKEKSTIRGKGRGSKKEMRV